MKVDFEKIFTEMQDGLYVTDTNRKIIYWNKGAEEITGFEGNEVVNSHCYDNILVHIDDKGVSLCKEGCPLAASIADGQHRSAEVYLQHKDKHRKPVRVKTIPMRDEKGEIVGCAELFTDLSNEKAYLLRVKELESIVFLDTLTGLFNRRYVEHFIETKLSEKERIGIDFGVLFIDIDKFKNFNDTYGHNLGDLALKTVAKTLNANMRSYDICGRWGGEEFVVVVCYTNITELNVIAERIRILIRTSYLDFDNKPLNITASIGCCLVDAHDNAASIIARADSLMYESKKAGRDRVTIR